MKEIISTDKAPAAIGPYSQGVKAGGFLFLSGQIALDPKTMAVVEGDAAQLLRDRTIPPDARYYGDTNLGMPIVPSRRNGPSGMSGTLRP